MSHAPDIFRFRAMPAAAAPEMVDAENGVIRGVSVMQAVEARGHGMMIDDKSLQQVADLGNAATGKGVKVRFGHPGMCDNALGKMVGHATAFRVAGDKALADIHLAAVAAKSPSGNLREYIINLAKDNASDFGMSVVIKAKKAWKLSAGGEAISETRPDNAVGDLPFARVEQLRAVDFVDEPAANRDGLFANADLVAAFSATSGELAEQAFAELDRLREENGIDLAAIVQFAHRYTTSRQPKTPGKSMKLTAEVLLALTSEFSDQLAVINEAAKAGDDEGQVRAKINDARFASLNAKVATLTEKLTKAESDMVEKLAAAETAHNQTKAKLAALSALGTAGNKDPGGESTDTDPEVAMKTEFDALTSEQKKGYGSDFGIFRAYVLNERNKK